MLIHSTLALVSIFASPSSIGRPLIQCGFIFPLTASSVTCTLTTSEPGISNIGSNKIDSCKNKLYVYFVQHISHTKINKIIYYLENVFSN